MLFRVRGKSGREVRSKGRETVLRGRGGKYEEGAAKEREERRNYETDFVQFAVNAKY